MKASSGWPIRLDKWNGAGSGFAGPARAAGI